MKKIQCGCPPYEGADPYLYFCFAEKDREAAFPLLEYLHFRGVRIWYNVEYTADNKKLNRQQETAWILCAICAINGAPQPEIQRDIRNFWVEEQREYHRKAVKKTPGQMEKHDRILGTAMKISILIYAAALVYEFAFGGLAIRPLLTLNDPENGRTLLKIVLGTLSAGTLFMANYYGKMSLRRVTSDHEKMVKFFDKAAEQLDRYGQNEHLLEALAREELAENGNWCSFQRDNTPELNL